MVVPIAVWKTIIVIGVLFVFPGYCVLRFVNARKRVELLRSEAAFLSVALSLLLTCFVGLVLAEVSQFSLTKLSLVMLIVFTPLLLLSLRKRARPTMPETKKWWWALGLVLLILLSSGLMIRGFEYVLYGRDTAPYLSWGTNIAEHGSLHVYYDEAAGLNAEEQRLLSSRDHWGTTVFTPGVGYANSSTGELGRSYFPLYSVLIAISLKMFGLKGTLTVANPFVAILALLSIIFLTRRLLGEKVALLGGFFLAINALTIYFARYPTPEIFTQLTIFCGLLCFYYFWKGSNPLWGIVSAFVLAQSFIAHFDMYALLIPIFLGAVFLAVARKARGRNWSLILWFLFPLIVLTIYSFWHQHHFSKYYLNFSVRMVFRGNQGIAMVVGFISILAALIVLAGFVWMRYREKISLAFIGRFVTRWWRVAVASLAVVFGLSAYFILPKLKDSGLQIGKLPPLQTQNFVMIFWYLTPIVMPLVLCGAFLYIYRDLNVDNVMLFTVGAFFSLLYTYNRFCQDSHIWVMRRYISVVIPFFLVLVAVFIVWIWKGSNSLWRRNKSSGGFAKWGSGGLLLVPIALVLAIVIGFSLYSPKIVDEVEWKGTLANLEEITAVTSGAKNMLLLWGKWGVTAYPETLRGIYGEDCFPLSDPATQMQTFEKMLKKWKAEGKTRVYLVSTERRGVPVLPPGYHARLIKMSAAFVSLLQIAQSRKPEVIANWTWPTDFYEIEKNQNGI